MGFPQRLLGDDEALVLALRPHVKVLARPFLVLVVVAPLAGFVAGRVPDGSAQPWLRWAVVVLAAVLLLRWTAWPFLVWWNTVYAVTTDRLVLRRGVLNRSGHDMPLGRLNDISFSHTVWERMLGCGTLVVESAGERGQLTLDDVPRVEHVQRTLYRLSDAAREGAGRVRRDIDEAGGTDQRDEADRTDARDDTDREGGPDMPSGRGR
jgi:uncharacterized membrane protein YdbT with pleckstrin-like domain